MFAVLGTLPHVTVCPLPDKFIRAGRFTSMGEEPLGLPPWPAGGRAGQPRCCGPPARSWLTGSFAGFTLASLAGLSVVLIVRSQLRDRFRVRVGIPFVPGWSLALAPGFALVFRSWLSDRFALGIASRSARPALDPA